MLIVTLLSLLFAQFAQLVPIYGHRGLMKEAPEDTLASYRACIQAGLSIELDIQLTKDGVPVILHDPTVNRTTNGKGRVADFTVADLKRLDAGSWFDPRFRDERIPTFEEVLQLIVREDKNGTTRIVIDHKDATRDAEAKVARLVDQYHMTDRVIVLSANLESLARYKAASPNIPVATIASTREDMLRVAGLPGIDLVWLTSLFPGAPSPEDVALVERKGKAVVQAFPKNDPALWRQAVANGVKHVVTDYPREAKADLEASRRR